MLKQGPRLHLREHRRSDEAEYLDWQSDPEVAHYLSWLPKSRAESLASLIDSIEQQSAVDRRRYFMAVVLTANGEMIGDVGITINNDCIGHIGWFLRRQFWGRGYASEATELMIGYGFTQLGLREIQASCLRMNRASERIMQKCGFTLLSESEGRLYYALNNREWRNGTTSRQR